MENKLVIGYWWGEGWWERVHRGKEGGKGLLWDYIKSSV